MGGVADAATTPYVVWLGDPLCSRAELAGNKGATLAALTKLGYEVPRGFCLTTAALSAGSDAYREGLVEAVRRLRSPWAARSSSTAEDAKGHALPGVFATVLDLFDMASLEQAIEKIEMGVRSEVVLTYARSLGVDPEQVKMAILVQELVLATVAGVAFSRDPITQEDSVVIESNFGLGGTVVDGSIIPDSFVVNGKGQLIDRTLGSKQQKVVATTRGARIRRVETNELERSSLSLDNDAVLAVAKVTRRLEADLGYPVDFEWAFAGERLYVLQARPITAIEGPDTEQGLAA